MCVWVCVCEVLEMLEVLAASKVLGGFKVLGMLEMVCVMWAPNADICVDPGRLVMSLFKFWPITKEPAMFCTWFLCFA